MSEQVSSHDAQESSPGAVKAALEIVELSREFGGVRAVDGLSAGIPADAVTGLVGPNGAGKSTILNLVCGQDKPTTGQISFDGERLDGRLPEQIARVGIARTFQTPKLFGLLSVLENVALGSEARLRRDAMSSVIRMPRWQRLSAVDRNAAMEALTAVGASSFANAVPGALPYSYQRAVEIARALLLNPKMILLDEPAAGMNASECDALVDLLRHVHERGIGLIVVEHNLKVVEALCDDVIVVDHGRLIARGAMDHVLQDEAVIAAYVGERRG